MMSDFEVCLGETESPSDFYVKFHAPKDSEKTNHGRMDRGSRGQRVTLLHAALTRCICRCLVAA